MLLAVVFAWARLAAAEPPCSTVYFNKPCHAPPTFDPPSQDDLYVKHQYGTHFGKPKKTKKTTAASTNIVTPRFHARLAASPSLPKTGRSADDDYVRGQYGKHIDGRTRPPPTPREKAQLE